jgi:GntR family transcriptional regulator
VIESGSRPEGDVATVPAEPEYQRIAADLRRRIEAGEWPPGAKLPTQEDMAAHYGVSVQPVKLALFALEFAGLVERRRGRSAVVADRRNKDSR